MEPDGEPMALAKTTAEEKYRAILAEQEREGLSRAEAAARAGVKPITLTWWRCELKRRERDGIQGRRKRAPTAPACPEFLPVQVRGFPGATSLGLIAPQPYEVVLASGRIVRVPRDFEGQNLQTLVRTLEEMPC
jgi:hypothetical protein